MVNLSQTSVVIEQKQIQYSNSSRCRNHRHVQKQTCDCSIVVLVGVLYGNESSADGKFITNICGHRAQSDSTFLAMWVDAKAIGGNWIVLKRYGCSLLMATMRHTCWKLEWCVDLQKRASRNDPANARKKKKKYVKWRARITVQAITRLEMHKGKRSEPRLEDSGEKEKRVGGWVTGGRGGWRRSLDAWQHDLWTPLKWAHSSHTACLLHFRAGTFSRRYGKGG